MKYQKCVITLEDGTKMVFYGKVQYDVELKPRFRKVIQFSVPLEPMEDNDNFKHIMDTLGLKEDR